MSLGYHNYIYRYIKFGYEHFCWDKLMKVWTLFIIYCISKYISLCSTNLNKVNEKGTKSHHGYLLETACKDAVECKKHCDNNYRIIKT